MPAPILINPDNRLLTWSTQDFALYGGQPPAGVIVARANPDGVTETPRGDHAGSDSNADDSGAAASFTALAGVVPAAPVDDRQAAAPVTAPFSDAPAPSPAVEGVNDAPQGSSTPPDILSASTSFARSEGQSDAADHAMIAATIADALADGNGTLGASLTQALDAAHATFDPLTNALVDGVSGQPVSDVLATPMVDSLIAPTADTLQGLAGADPAAGISTLVSMVQSDNLFDLRDATGAPAPADTFVDTLAVDPLDAGPALLGDHDSDDTGLPVEHHGDGILGGL